MKKRYSFKVSVIILSCLALAFALTNLYYSLPLFLIEMGVYVFAVAIIIFHYIEANRDLKKFLRFVGVSLDNTGSDGIDSFPIPICILNSKYRLEWYNSKFIHGVMQEEDCFGKNVQEFLKVSEQDIKSGTFEVQINNKQYTVYVYTRSSGQLKSKFYSLYFIDNTEFFRLRKEYVDSRPVIGIVTIDNFDEMLNGVKESRRAELAAKIEVILEDYFSTTTGFVRKFERDRFIVVIEDRHLEQLISDNFSILEKVKKLSENRGASATISIGFGRDADSISDGLDDARIALDKSLGRGGDQVTIKRDNDFVSYGGKTEGTGKRTQVLARMMASDIVKFAKHCSNVIIMGHRYSDFDCVASAIGLHTVFESFGIDSAICIDETATFSTSLIEKLKSEGYDDTFITPRNAEILLNDNTLLVIVDTNNPELLEHKVLSDMAKNKILIDHHRMVPNHVTGTQIFYHEPFASSTCELVSELLQYVDGDITLSPVAATAMLAGIMLDTKDFVLQTGSRTFEAAAFLRRMGADTVEAKRLFAGSIESFELVSKTVVSAQLYRGCAVAICPPSAEGYGDVVPKAADELLYISGVDASFVLSSGKNGIKISARSMGKINVQYILESIGGGGGHFTAAALVLENIDTDTAITLVCNAIDKYFDK